MQRRLARPGCAHSELVTSVTRCGPETHRNYPLELYSTQMRALAHNIPHNLVRIVLRDALHHSCLVLNVSR